MHSVFELHLSWSPLRLASTAAKGRGDEQRLTCRRRAGNETGPG